MLSNFIGQTIRLNRSAYCVRFIAACSGAVYLSVLTEDARVAQSSVQACVAQNACVKLSKSMRLAVVQTIIGLFCIFVVRKLWLTTTTSFFFSCGGIQVA